MNYKLRTFFLFLVVACLSAQAQTPWKLHVIDNSSSEADGVKLTDINNDGRLDIATGWEEAVVAERTNNTIRICTRPVKQGTQWKEQSIQIPPSTGNAKSVAVGDIEMDGSYDFIVSTETGKQIKNGLIWQNGKHYLSQIFQNGTIFLKSTFQNMIMWS